MTLDVSRCPRCGASNACAMASGAAADCWCTRVQVPAGLLAQLPDAARGVACLCERCIALFTDDASAEAIGQGANK
ncbi:MAG TPA: cysteine-rich CWC family protein [Casimicrobiaceae bacterium]|nr:cysteine-rich CWC family protein [Casimicrobiaceae bacterium]